MMDRITEGVFNGIIKNVRDLPHYYDNWKRFRYDNVMPDYKIQAHTLLQKEYEMFFNRYYSSYWGLGVAEYPTIPRLNEVIEDIELDGRNSSLTIKSGTYKDRTISITFRLLDSNRFWSMIDDFEDWLLNVTDNRLFYDRQDRCFIVKRVIFGNISKEIRKYGELQVDFIVKPFMTDISPSSITFLENEKLFINQGHFPIEPIITFYGSGDIQISINGEITTIEDVENEVTIDSEYMVCFDKNLNNKLRDMSGNFPKLSVGENDIEVSNNVAKVTIKYTNFYR